MTILGTIRIDRPTTGCTISIEELISLIERGAVSLDTGTGTVISFGPDEPPVDARRYPWIKVDANGSPLGTWVYSTKYSIWCRDLGAALGERRTVLRVENSIEDDREKKSIAVGWALCNGDENDLDYRDKDKTVTGSVTGGGGGTYSILVPEIRGYFDGLAPDYDLYTVIFTGF